MVIKNKVRMEHNKNVNSLYIFYVYFLYNKIIKFIQKKSYLYIPYQNNI